MKTPSPQLVILYKKMADFTAPECAGVGPGSCRVPHSCCDEFACSITREYASEVYGVELEEYQGSPKGAFYLRESGCTVAPHLRPHCTMHTCAINGLGFKHGDRKWTKQYFTLRKKIEDLEVQA